MAHTARSPRRTGPQQRVKRAHAGAGPHVVVVEDDKDILNVVVLLLTGDGFRVSSTTEGDEAIATMNAEPVNLLVTDLRLADGDGIDIIRHAARVTPLRPAIIVLTAARAPEETSAAQLFASVNAVIVQKPFDIDYLLDLARSLTGWHGRL